MADKVVAEVACSAGRRLSGVVITAGLGAALIWSALAQPPEAAGWQALIVALGLVALVSAVRVYRATARKLVLTETQLRDDTGRALVAIDRIDRIERGMFAFKPSNGFVLRLKEPAPPAWQPGLWWRWGRKLAVGGVPSGHDTRALADAIQAMLDRRD